MSSNKAPQAWDLGRAVLPHQDPTFDAVAKLLDNPDPLTDWKLVGPRRVDPDANEGHPALTGTNVAVNLSAGLTRAVLEFLSDRAEQTPSRSGKTATWHLKRKGTQ